MRKVLVLSLCLLIPFIFLACAAPGSDPAGGDSEINVVTTIYPLADIAGQLGGDMVNARHLLPAGASPHTHEPTVEQARLIDEADLFIYIGAGLDDWAVKLAEAAEPGPVMLDLSKEVDLIEAAPHRPLVEEGEEINGHNGHDCQAHDHDHGPVDPHFWLDPVLVREFVCPAVHEKLVTMAPGEEDYFDNNLEQYRGELSALDKEIRQTAAAFSRDRFIAFHSAWQYFARRYGLQEVAVIAEFPGQEPSAGWIAELSGLVEEENIGAIFTEPQFSPDLAERVAEESGSKVLVLDPIGGENISGRDSYLALMRYNLEIFQKALE